MALAGAFHLVHAAACSPPGGFDDKTVTQCAQRPARM
jgi:hypothetical protein